MIVACSALDWPLHMNAIIIGKATVAFANTWQLL